MCRISWMDIISDTHPINSGATYSFYDYNMQEMTNKKWIRRNFNNFFFACALDFIYWPLRSIVWSVKAVKICVMSRGAIRLLVVAPARPGWKLTETMARVTRCGACGGRWRWCGRYMALSIWICSDINLVFLIQFGLHKKGSWEKFLHVLLVCIQMWWNLELHKCENVCKSLEIRTFLLYVLISRQIWKRNGKKINFKSDFKTFRC